MKKYLLSLLVLTAAVLPARASGDPVNCCSSTIRSAAIVPDGFQKLDRR